MNLKEILAYLKANGFETSKFSKAYSSSGNLVCDNGYVYKNGEHVATINKEGKNITTFAIVPSAYGGREAFEKVLFSEINEEYLKNNLVLHTEEEYNKIYQWKKESYVLGRINEAIKYLDKDCSNVVYHDKLKEKLLEALEVMKDVKPLPEKYLTYAR